MSRIESTLLCALAVMFGAGCQGDLPSAPDVPVQSVGPLDLVAPLFDPNSLVRVERQGREPGALDRAPEGIDVRDVTFSASIISPATTAHFGDGYAAATGRHHYTGNVGRIVTEAVVAFMDQSLGEARAERQQYGEFLLDFGTTKFIWVSAHVASDKLCGLSVYGDSQHYASWEFNQFNRVQRFGEVIEHTRAPLAKQRACTTRTDTYPAGGGTVGGDRYHYCTYLITYDLDTGQIYRRELLFCTAGTEDERF